MFLATRPLGRRVKVLRTAGQYTPPQWSRVFLTAFGHTAWWNAQISRLNNSGLLTCAPIDTPAEEDLPSANGVDQSMLSVSASPLHQWSMTTGRSQGLITLEEAGGFRLGEVMISRRYFFTCCPDVPKSGTRSGIAPTRCDNRVPAPNVFATRPPSGWHYHMPIARSPHPAPY